MKKLILYIMLLFPVLSYGQRDNTDDNNVQATYELSDFINFNGIIDSAWNGKMSIGSNWLSGNVKKFDLTTNYLINRTDSFKQIELDGRYYTLYSYGDKTWEESALNFRYELKPYNKLIPFTAYLFYRNQFRMIDTRNSVLLGIKYNVFGGKKEKLTISTAIVYENSNYTEETLDGKLSNTRYRLSIRPKIKIFGNDKLSLTHQTFLKISFTNILDYSIESSTILSYKITKNLSISLNDNLIYDRLPIQIKYKRITPYDNALVWTVTYDF